MNSKWHLYISLVKSAIRIEACILLLTTGNIFLLAGGFLLAEMLGLAEEFGDKR